MIVENIVLVVSLIFLGGLMRRSDRFPQNTASVLNSFVLNISLPAIIIISVSKLQLSSELIYPIAIHWFALALHLVFVFAAYKIFKFSRSVLGCLIIVTTLGNTAFIGIPMSKGFFGDNAVPFAVLYDQLGSGIGFILYGAFILPLFTGGKQQKLKEIGKKLLTFPAFLALILGLALSFLPPIPELVTNTLLQLSSTLIPCAMIAVGFSMKYKVSKTTLIPLVTGLSIKLLILPLVILFVVKSLFGLEGIAVDTAILQSGMPPMITAGAMASAAKLEDDLSVAFVGFGLLVSFVTLVLVKFLL